MDAISVGIVPDTVTDDDRHDEGDSRVSIVCGHARKLFEIGGECGIGEDSIFRGDDDRERDITITTTSEDSICRTTCDIGSGLCARPSSTARTSSETHSCWESIGDDSFSVGLSWTVIGHADDIVHRATISLIHTTSARISIASWGRSIDIFFERNIETEVRSDIDIMRDISTIYQ